MSSPYIERIFPSEEDTLDDEADTLCEASSTMTGKSEVTLREELPDLQQQQEQQERQEGERADQHGIVTPFPRLGHDVGLDPSQWSTQEPWIQSDIARILSFEATADQLPPTVKWLRGIVNIPIDIGFSRVPTQTLHEFHAGLTGSFPIESLILQAHDLRLARETLASRALRQLSLDPPPVNSAVELDPSFRRVLLSRFIFYTQELVNEEMGNPANLPDPEPMGVDERLIRRLRRVEFAVGRTSRDMWILNQGVESSHCLLSGEPTNTGWLTLRNVEFQGGEGARAAMKKDQICEALEEWTQGLGDQHKVKAMFLWKDLIQNSDFRRSEAYVFNGMINEMEVLHQFDGNSADYPRKKELLETCNRFSTKLSWPKPRWRTAQTKVCLNMDALRKRIY